MKNTAINRKILLVDDDPDVLFTLRKSLEHEFSGVEIVESKDGDEAIRKYDEHEPGLIVLDLMLPRRSGFLVMEHVRSKSERMDDPYIICITANSGKRHEDWAYKSGANDYLTKPFRIEDLTNRIKGQYGMDEGYEVN
jgi:DNA-binding response OmpR family regulator